MRPKERKLALNELSRPFGMVCWYCGFNLNGRAHHIDHIVPKCKGGTDDWDNLSLTCSFCNMAKQDRDLDEFLLWLEHVKTSRPWYKPGQPHPNSHL